MNVPVGSLLVFLAVPGLLTAGIGAYPTWAIAGPSGLAAAGAAGAAVFLAMFVSGCAMLWRSGPRAEQVANRFAGSAIIRIAICLAAAALAWYLFRLPIDVLLLWTGLFYVAMLVGECIWLARTLRRRAGGGGR